MTPQEALNILYKGIAPNPTANNECIELCKKALEKQIPKKPLNPCGRYRGLAKGGNCPICGSHTNSSTSNYCRKCGQALDWSDNK